MKVKVKVKVKTKTEKRYQITLSEEEAILLRDVLGDMSDCTEERKSQELYNILRNTLPDAWRRHNLHRKYILECDGVPLVKEYYKKR